MKKVNSIIMGMICILAVSCSPEQDSSPNLSLKSNETEIAERIYNEIIAINDLNTQINIVNAYDPSTQVALWKLKLNNYTINNDLSQNEYDAFEKLELMMTLENFLEIRKKNPDVKIANEIKNLQKRIIANSPANVGNYFFTNFENVNQTLNKLDLKNKNIAQKNEPVESCDCTKDSDCTRIVGIGFPSIEWEYGECKSNSCYRPSYLFGWFESDNNSICQYGGSVGPGGGNNNAN